MDRRDNCLLEPRRSKTHLPSPVRQSKEGHGRFDPSLRSELIQNIDRRLRELAFNDSLFPVRKSMPSRPFGLELQNDDALRRRGSVYQSSKEMRKMRSQRDQRRKPEIKQAGDDFLSFDILDSSTLSHHMEDKKVGPSKKVSQDASSSHPHSSSTNVKEITRENAVPVLDLSSRYLPDDKPSTSGSDDYVRKDDKLDGLLEISLTDKDPSCYSGAASELVGRGVADNNKASTSDEVRPPENDANARPERDKLQALPKSFSAKVELLNPLKPVEDTVHRGDTKSRYSAFRRILDPIGKSKSQRNPSFLQADTSCTRVDDPNNVTGSDVPITSTPKDVSCRISNTENVEQVMQVKQGVQMASPVHFKGILKQESRQGVPYFEFFLKDSDDVLTAKKWKTDSTLNWVYTFYTNKRKNSTTGRGVRDRNRSPILIGQMQASCYLCSEVGKSGSVDNSTVSEFVLYDIAQARRSMAADEGVQRHGPTNHQKPPDVDATTTTPTCNNSPNCEKGNLPSRHGHDSEGDTSDLLPWAPSKLLPHLENTAIVASIPIEKKLKTKDSKKNETCAKSNSSRSANFKVITPSTRHGLPSEEGCPSPLLHRWRSGGGCDCGGWDMGCSITVLENNAGDDSRDNSSENQRQIFMLSVQGSKDALPTFALKSHPEGYHSICFHAQLSSLQAFSISVAILHCLTSATDALDKGMPILHSNSLKLLLEEEVKQLLNCVAEEEKRKTKMVIEPMPPFSPIGRV